MKTFLSAVAFLAFIGILFFACSDTVIPPVQSSQTILQKPGNGEGAGILRYEAENYAIFLDFDAQLMLFIGVNDLAAACSDEGGFDVMKYKELLLPNADPELRRLILTITCRDAAAMVWQVGDWPADLCEFALNNEPLAIGIVDYKYTDNDFNAWWQEHPNRNPYGYKANGSLIGSNGQEYTLNFFDRFIYDWDGSKFNENIQIHLVPKGN